MYNSTELDRGANSESSSAPTPSRGLSRRSFLVTGLAAGAAAGLGPLGSAATALASPASTSALSAGDAAILRFLAAAELIEADLWQQYNELGGIQDGEEPLGTGNVVYTKALLKLDSDLPQYIHDNTDDEKSHFTFINAYLESRGAEAVNLDPFRTLPSSKAKGAAQIGRLTNLMELTVDTSWWTRYRSDTKNPDFGASFAQAIPGLKKGRFPAIPRTTPTSSRMTTSRRSPTLPGFTSAGSSRPAPASTHSSRSK